MKPTIGVVLSSGAIAWMFAACSGKSADAVSTSVSASSSIDPTTDGTPSVDAAASAGSGGNGGASATSGQGGMMMGQGGTSTSASSTAATAAASSASSAASTSAAASTAASSASSAAASSSSTGVQLINGCDPAKATDMTGMANVNATAQAWQVGYQFCVKVSKNTKVSWTGNWTFHPLYGGVSPNKDANSQITQLNATSGTNTVTTTFKQAGTYPYFCGVHTGTMLGVIFVQ